MVSRNIRRDIVTNFILEKGEKEEIVAYVRKESK